MFSSLYFTHYFTIVPLNKFLISNIAFSVKCWPSFFRKLLISSIIYFTWFFSFADAYVYLYALFALFPTSSSIHFSRSLIFYIALCVPNFFISYSNGLKINVSLILFFAFNQNHDQCHIWKFSITCCTMYLDNFAWMTVFSLCCSNSLMCYFFLLTSIL